MRLFSLVVCRIHWVYHYFVHSAGAVLLEAYTQRPLGQDDEPVVHLPCGVWYFYIYFLVSAFPLLGSWSVG